MGIFGPRTRFIEIVEGVGDRGESTNNRYVLEYNYMYLLIILIMRSWTGLSAVLMTKYRLKSQILGHGVNLKILLQSSAGKESLLDEVLHHQTQVKNTSVFLI